MVQQGSFCMLGNLLLAKLSEIYEYMYVTLVTSVLCAHTHHQISKHAYDIVLQAD